MYSVGFNYSNYSKVSTLLLQTNNVAYSSSFIDSYYIRLDSVFKKNIYSIKLLFVRNLKKTCLNECLML